jgi:hypothetical protein
MKRAPDAPDGRENMDAPRRSQAVPRAFRLIDGEGRSPLQEHILLIALPDRGAARNFSHVLPRSENVMLI